MAPDPLLQQVQLLLYRDDLHAALELLDSAYARTANPLYKEHAERVRGWTSHLRSREAYAEAYETYYHGLKGRFTLKHLERDLRVWLGFKTRRVVERTAKDAEFKMLEREVNAQRPHRVFDAGSGEGRVALTLAARHPSVQVDAIDVSPTNVKLASRMNRYTNLRFHCGLIEDAARLLPADSVDLAYSFAVLEHVRDVDEVVSSIMSRIRPGGRFCFVVPMNEFIVNGDLPDCRHEDGVAGHVREFSEARLRDQFGTLPGFTLEKIPGAWPHDYPAALTPVEFGSFFVTLTKP
jgi:2-polyprenyl-3-methyl-5-hydroxy-6-metoxy-1,4-benzoquinol methylase